MNRINLTKYGFVRCEEEDFSDDGNRFYCYKAGRRVLVSKHVNACSGQVYLSASIDGDILRYETYSKLSHYHMLNRLNGVPLATLTDSDLAQLYEDCVEYEKEYDEAERQVVFPTIEALQDQCMKVREHYAEQLAKAKAYIKEHAFELVMKARGYALDAIKDYLATIERYANGFNPDTFPQSVQNTARGIEFAKPDARELTEHYWYDSLIQQVDEVVA